MAMNDTKYNANVLRGCTHATIRAAFNKSAEIMESHGDRKSTNITSILTYIIQVTGRYNEHWGSDALYQFDKLRAMAECDFDLDMPLDEVISFGIREDGVDHGAYIVQNLLASQGTMQGYAYARRHYRKILAVRVKAYYDRDLNTVRTEFSLRDLTNSLSHVDPADVKPGEFKLIQLPTDSKASPEPSDEKDRIDQDAVKKAMAGWYKSFLSREVPAEKLAEEGCSEGVRCIEVYGLWAEPAPAPKDPSDTSVCRVYHINGTAAVCWTNRLYQGFQGAEECVSHAREFLLEFGH